MSGPEGPSRNTNAKTAQMVNLITQIGPDIPEISRTLGQFKESVRYRYKSFVQKRGLAVQAMVDHEKLGLRSVIASLEFTPAYAPYSEAILTAMSEICYLVSFERTFPHGGYVVHASVPTEYVDEWRQMFGVLESRGLFKIVDTVLFDWFRNSPMKAQYYDFEKGSWSFDWSPTVRAGPEAVNFRPSERADFDQVDLLIVKELSADATRPLVELSKRLRINYKKLTWHYSTHVRSQKLIRGYNVRWPGTKYDYSADRPTQRQHKYFWVDLVVKDVNGVEGMSLMEKMNAIPFLWAEAGGDNYFAQLAFPVDSYTEAMQYMHDALSEVGHRAELHLPDQAHALQFTVGYKLFDAKDRRWRFESGNILRMFDDLMLKIKKGEGS